MEKDGPFYPVDIGFLGSRTISGVFDFLTDLIEQLGLLGCWKTDRGNNPGCERNGKIVLQREPL